jgi:hypothetical protein
VDGERESWLLLVWFLLGCLMAALAVFVVPWVLSLVEF